MKHGSFKVVCLIFMASIAVASAFSDENTVNLESRILEEFNGDSAYEWKVEASKFAYKDGEETYPKVTYVPAWPQALYGSTPEEEQKSLGVWGKFNRRGYNWIDLIPNGDDGIPIPGRVQSLDLWVWGSNLNYYIEAYLRDYQGFPHVIRLGSLAYTGWKNLMAKIPGSIPQSKRVLPRRESLKFIKFRIWTQPNEPVDNFYIYLDHFKVLTDMFETLYDGKDLELDYAKAQELWGGGGAASGEEAEAE